MFSCIRISKSTVRSHFNVLAQYLRRISGNNTICRHGLRYDSPRTDNATITNLHARQYQTSTTYKAVLADPRMEIEPARAIMTEYSTLKCKEAIFSNMHPDRIGEVKFCRKRDLARGMEIHPQNSSQIP
jgi:hypothetical protein